MRTLIHVLATLGMKEKIQLGLLSLLRVAIGFLDLFGIFLLGAAVAIASGNAGSLGGLMAQLQEISLTFGLPNAYALVAFVALLFFTFKGLSAMWLNANFAKLVAKLEHKATVDLFSKIMHSDLDRLANWDIPTIKYGLGSPSEMLYGRFIIATGNVITELALIGSIAIFLLLTDALLFLLLGIFFLAVALFMNIGIGRQISILSKRVDAASLRESVVSQDALDNFRQIRALGREQGFIQTFGEHHKLVAMGAAKLANLSTLPRYVLEIAMMIALAFLVAQRSILGDFALDASTVAIFAAGALRMAAALLPLQGSLGLITQIEEVIRLPLAMQSWFKSNAPKRLESSSLGKNVLCKLSGVSYSYGDGKPVISNVDFELNTGEIVAIVGPSGGGKSTLAELILGLRVPTSGKLEYSTDTSTRLGYVPQKTTLIFGSLRDNLLLGATPRNVPERDIEEVVKLCQLENLVSKLPSGLDTKVGGDGLSLSGGELQRIGIARALIAKARLIVMDEVTSALDVETENLISRSLQSLKHSTSLVIVAHRPSTIAIADRVYQLKEGELQRI